MHLDGSRASLLSPYAKRKKRLQLSEYTAIELRESAYCCLLWELKEMTIAWGPVEGRYLETKSTTILGVAVIYVYIAAEASVIRILTHLFFVQQANEPAM